MSFVVFFDDKSVIEIYANNSANAMQTARMFGHGRSPIVACETYTVQSFASYSTAVCKP